VSLERLRDEHGYGGGLTIVKDYAGVMSRLSMEADVTERQSPNMNEQ
jgi:hypothetical protein